MIDIVNSECCLWLATKDDDEDEDEDDNVLFDTKLCQTMNVILHVIQVIIVIFLLNKSQNDLKCEEVRREEWREKKRDGKRD